jgi:hypothetical protein
VVVNGDGRGVASAKWFGKRHDGRIANLGLVSSTLFHKVDAALLRVCVETILGRHEFHGRNEK